MGRFYPNRLDLFQDDLTLVGIAPGERNPFAIGGELQCALPIRIVRPENRIGWRGVWADFQTLKRAADRPVGIFPSTSE